MFPRFRTTGMLLGAFARRAWIQQRLMLLLIAGLMGMVFGGMLISGRADTGDLQALTGLIPTREHGLVTVYSGSGTFLAVESYLMTMAPALTGMAVAIVATLTLPGVVADDVKGGGIETLLAGPIPRRILFSAYLGGAGVLTGVGWVVTLVAFLITVMVGASLFGLVIHASLEFAAALVLIPLSMGIWSGAATLFGALLYPQSLDTVGGMNGGPIRFLALLPPMLLVPVVLLLPDHVGLAMVVMVGVTVLASFGIIQLTARGFNSEKVLHT